MTSVGQCSDNLVAGQRWMPGFSLKACRRVAGVMGSGAQRSTRTAIALAAGSPLVAAAVSRLAPF